LRALAGAVDGAARALDAFAVCSKSAAQIVQIV
jgi:hypothetical protein